MKKISISLVILGVGFVCCAYFFSQKSARLIDEDYLDSQSMHHQPIKQPLELNEDQLDSLRLNNHLIEQQLKLKNSLLEELKDDRNLNFKNIEIDMNQYYTFIKPCIDNYQKTEKVSEDCAKYLMNVVVEDFEELGFINAIIGSCINYEFLTYKYWFLKDLFLEKASIQQKITLAFLNKYRDPKVLEEAYYKYKDILFSKISKTMYQKIFEKEVNDCLSAYQEIARQKDADAFFEDIYFKADSQYLHGAYWKYTFWKRRMIEKNDAIIYKILTEIKQHYQSI